MVTEYCNERKYRALFAPDREVSNVYIEEHPPRRRYFSFKYKGRSLDHLTEFEEALKDVLPCGTKYFGGFCKRVWNEEFVEDVENGYPFELFRREGDDTEWNGCYEERWVEVLVDFGLVEEETRLSLMQTSFGVMGLNPAVRCFRTNLYEDGSGGELFPGHEITVLDRVYELQRRLSVNIDVIQFGELLVEEIGV